MAIPTSTIFFRCIVVRDVGILLMLIRFVGLVVYRVVFGKGGFFGGIIPLFRCKGQRSAISRYATFFVGVRSHFRRFGLFFR